MREKRFPDRRMTDLEMSAVTAMAEGNLVPLAKLLAEENHEVHPVVQRALLHLIAGSPSHSDYRIFVQDNPGFTNKSDGPRRTNNQKRDLAIALRIVDQADYIDGEWEFHKLKESVISSIVNDGKTKLGRSTINSIWSEQEPFIRFCISHGSYVPRNMRKGDGVSN